MRYSLHGVLKALDGYLLLKNIEPPKGSRKSVTYYQHNIVKQDKNLLAGLNTVYSVLHLSGYYNSITNVPVIAEGYEIAYDIIDKIKPAD